MRTVAYVVFMVASAAAWTTLAWRGPVTGDLAFWFVASLLAELMWIRLPLGQATVSMASCVHFALLLLLPPGQTMAVVAISSGIADAVLLRKPAHRVVFNSAQSALAVGAASLALGLFGGGTQVLRDSAPALGALGLILAGLTYFVVNSGAVSGAVALTERTSLAAAWKHNFGTRYELISSAALFSLGVLLANQYLQAGPLGALVVVLPVVLAHQGYRLYMSQHAELLTARASRKAA